MGSVKEYKCLNCKAGLEFDPPSQHWKCHYCFSEFTKEQIDAVYKKAEDSLDKEEPELNSYHCTSCGAELIADDTTAATFCLYCKNPTIIRSRFSGKFKPKNLIPFKLTKAQAQDLYKKWIGKRIFAPSEFKQKEEIEKITGIYAPFWLFDTRAEGMIDGEGTRVKSWTQGKYRYTQTSYYRVLRKGNALYKKVPVDASKKLDDKYMHMIEPYDYSALTDFSIHYMSGFMAEKYDVEAGEAKGVMKERVEKYIEDKLRTTVSGYSSYNMRNKQVMLMDTTEDYCMLPVYLLINKYKGKEHVFIVNGQTGKVVGDTPISFKKQLLFGLAVYTAVWLVAVFGGAIFV
ncbi:DNA helicase PriA [Clostridium thermarum]|uniref:DNA helicase PriA n=1 Tax=Clostridium thermarum TaxID=1716543 RepID=UPI001122A610|nr:DNA helicase PriA [Clostridium thermarum]